jgi:hypothetical protein
MLFCFIDARLSLIVRTLENYPIEISARKAKLQGKYFENSLILYNVYLARFAVRVWHLQQPTP